MPLPTANISFQLRKHDAGMYVHSNSAMVWNWLMAHLPPAEETGSTGPRVTVFQSQEKTDGIL